MGVHGLSTFLRENKRTLAKSAEFTTHYDAQTSLVIDAWSFIYNLSRDATLPWVYGGEYGDFATLVIRVVQAWLAVGLKPCFVFDGPYQPEKIPTALSRLNQSHVQPALLFFRTSPASRTSPRFLHETRIIPPLVYPACLAVLQAFLAENPDTLELHFADDEADPYAVALAARLCGYVAGQDSDFVVLNAEGYRGYMPLDEMAWVAAELETAAGDDDGEFQTVRSSKSRKKASSRASAGRGLVPPNTEGVMSGLSLSAAIYSPTVLAQHFKLPVTTLPLVGALVGNDFTLHSSSSAAATAGSFQPQLFDRRFTLSQRISYAAATLASLLRPAAAPLRRKQKAPQSVMELIAMTVATLLGPATTVASGTQAAIVERVVEATLPYTIPKAGQDGMWPSSVCALHVPDDCPLFVTLFRASLNSTGEGDDLELLQRREEIVLLYVNAYRAGALSPSVMDVLATRTYWPELFLEDPDVESVARSVGRAIRVLCYALLQDGTGLLEYEIEDAPEDGSEEEDDPDELIDVVEEDSDADEMSFPDVATLRGALRGLQLEETDGEDAVTGSVDEPPESMTTSAVSSRRRAARRTAVVEYVRKGSRVVGEEVDVPPLHTLVLNFDDDGTPSSPPPSPDSVKRVVGWTNTFYQLQPASSRVSLMLRFLQSDTPAIRALDSPHLLPVLSVRAVVRAMHIRAIEHGSSGDRERERWTRREVRAFLASLRPPPVVVGTSHSQPSIDEKERTSSAPEEITIAVRSIQLTAQLSMALESVTHLAQILLLTDRFPTCVHRFSGRRFHALLAGSDSDLDTSEAGAREELGDAWRAVSEGLDECFAAEILNGRKGKKARKKERNQNVVASALHLDANGGGGKENASRDTQGVSRFGVLSDMGPEL